MTFRQELNSIVQRMAVGFEAAAIRHAKKEIWKFTEFPNVFEERDGSFTGVICVVETTYQEDIMGGLTAEETHEIRLLRLRQLGCE